MASFSESYSLDKIKNFDTNRLVVIDTLKVDGPIMIGDTVAVFQDKYNIDELLFKIQREGNVIDNWIVKRKYVGGIDHKMAAASSRAAATTAAAINPASTSDNNTEENYGSDVYTDPGKKLANIMLIDDERDVLYSFKTVLASQGKLTGEKVAVNLYSTIISL